MSQSGCPMRESRIELAARVRSARTRAGSRSSRASRRTGSGRSREFDARRRRPGERQPAQDAPRLLDVRVVDDRGEEWQRRPAQDRSGFGDRSLARRQIVEHQLEQLLDHVSRCAGPEREARVTGQRFRGDDDGERMPAGERPDPHGVVATDGAGGEETIAVLVGQRTDQQFGQQGAPPGGRTPRHVGTSTAGQHRGDGRGQRRDELVADPAVEQVQPLEAVDHQDLCLGVGQLPGGDCSGLWCGSAKGCAQRCQRSRHRRLRPVPVDRHGLHRQEGERPVDQRGLADPARTVHEHDRWSVRLEQRAQAPTFGRAADHRGGGRRGQCGRRPSPAGRAGSSRHVIAQSEEFGCLRTGASRAYLDDPVDRSLAARRNRVKPPCSAMTRSCSSVACAPSAHPPGCDRADGVHTRVDAE